MSDDPVSTYVEVHQALKLATQQVENLVGLVRDAATRLQHWQYVIIQGYAPPSHLINAPAIDRLPTLQELGAAIDRWHKAKLTAENTWQKVPTDKRPSLQPPV